MSAQTNTQMRTSLLIALGFRPYQMEDDVAAVLRVERETGAGEWRMNRDYSDVNDSYGISEMTAQSADQDVRVRRKSAGDAGADIRGNTLLKPRSIPTQEEAGRIAKEQ